jgi:hypothetical protein
MPFPDGWPPRIGSGRASIRFYQTGTATANFEDNSYLFVDGAGANPYTPLPVVNPGDDASRFPTPAATVVPTVPAGTGQNDPDSPKPMIWSTILRVTNTGGNPLEFSFDGTNVHGEVPAGEYRDYSSRVEAGIAIRSALGATFVIEAW